MRAELKVRAAVVRRYRAALAAHPYALPPCALVRVVPAQVTHLLTILFRQEYWTARAEILIFSDAE
jgi:hypothetical protein